jgi:alkaline phosphatase
VPANAGTPAAPAAFYAPYADNTAEDAVAAGFGPGSEGLRGFVDNTFVFDLIRAQL